MQTKRLLLGDEAVALGAIHAGISGVYGYPGTPSTEIFEAIQGFGKSNSIHATWSANEKVAYEEALGMSFAGKRTLVTMKHVGLNVALDPFMSSALIGVNGGLVLVVADDPGMHSSQNEQDSRYLAQFAMIPVLEPATQQDAYDLTRAAFPLSETLNVPVMVRIVTRLAHSRANVFVESEGDAQYPLRPSKDRQRWTLLPANARKDFARLVQAQCTFLAESEMSPWNTFRPDYTSRKGIIVSGIAINYLEENLPTLEGYSVLSVKRYPVPDKKLKTLIDAVDEILVIEEGYPFIERHLLGVAGIPGKTIRGKLSGDLPRTGELNPDLVRKALGLPAFEHRTLPADLTMRPPQLCAGCPHSSMFTMLNEAMEGLQNGHVFGDIGCSTLGALPPHNTIESCVDMGASIGMGIGAAHAGVRPAVSVIGDSTFTHSGMTALLDAAHENTPLTVLLLDNAAVAMTGAQPVLTSGEGILNILRGLGVQKEHLIAIEPLPKNHEENVRKLRQELTYEGLSVVVAHRDCLEALRKQRSTKA